MAAEHRFSNMVQLWRCVTRGSEQNLRAAVHCPKMGGCLVGLEPTKRCRGEYYGLGTFDSLFRVGASGCLLTNCAAQVDWVSLVNAAMQTVQVALFASLESSGAAAVGCSLYGYGLSDRAHPILQYEHDESEAFVQAAAGDVGTSPVECDTSVHGLVPAAPTPSLVPARVARASPQVLLCGPARMPIAG